MLKACEEVRRRVAEVAAAAEDSPFHGADPATPSFSGGALAAPFAGRAADRGLIRAATGAAAAVLGVAFVSTGVVAGLAANLGGLLALAVLAVLIDATVLTTQVVAQRLVFAVPPAMRGRVTAIYMTCPFAGGALGSMVGTVLYHRSGWAAVAAVGTLAGLGLLAACLAERSAPEPIYPEEPQTAP